MPARQNKKKWMCFARSDSMARSLSLAFTLALVSLLLAAIFAAPRASSEETSSLSGYAWSDTIGWISLGCEDGCSGYGMHIGAGGVLSGYGWSDAIGWVSAEPADLSGCPEAPCSATMHEGALSGWLKALGGGGASDESGGWDGWISLSGSGWGPTADTSGQFSGYAWGSDVVGWVDFSGITTDYTECAAAFFCSENDRYSRDTLCREELVESCSYSCSLGACVPPPAPTPTADEHGDGTLRVTPSLVRSGGMARVSWNVAYADSCSITSTPNVGAWSGASGFHMSEPVFSRTEFKLDCTGAGGDLHQSAIVDVVPAWQER